LKQIEDWQSVDRAVFENEILSSADRDQVIAFIAERLKS